MTPSLRQRLPSLALLFLLGMWGAGCSSADAGDPAPPEGSSPQPGAEVVTWFDDIRPLIQIHCAHCHSQGEPAPGRFDSFDEAAPQAHLIAAYVSRGLMPPPTLNPAPLHHIQAAAPPFGVEERRRFQAWAEGGAPRGNEILAPPTPEEESPRSGLLQYPEWIVPFGEGESVMSCLALPPRDWDPIIGFWGAQKITGGSIQESLTLYRDPRGETFERYGREPFECPEESLLPGGQHGGLARHWEPLLEWGRGGGRVELPGGIPLERESYFILRVDHRRPPGGGSEVRDRSALTVLLGERAVPPLKLATVEASNFSISSSPSPQAILGEWTIPGAPGSSYGGLVAVSPTLGKIGVAVEMAVYHRSGERSVVFQGPYSALRQLTYQLEPEIPLGAGDRVEIRCTYDNGGGYYDPIHTPPTYVYEGEGPDHERCKASLWISPFSNGGEQ